MRTIKNDASKSVANKEMQRLKASLAMWRARAGEMGPEGEREVEDARQGEMEHPGAGAAGGGAGAGAAAAALWAAKGVKQEAA